MKRKFGYYAAAWTILLALFNVIAFVSAGWAGMEKYTPSFWVGYGYIILTFLIQLICTFYAFRETTRQTFFLKLPLITISYSALILSFIFGGLCTVLSPLPYWVGVILCASILTIYIIALIKANAAAELVQSVGEKAREKTLFLQNVILEAEGLLQRARSQSVKTSAKKVYEALRYASPASGEELSDVEWQITMKLGDMTEAVNADSGEAAEKAAEEIMTLIGDRARLCKQLLHEDSQTPTHANTKSGVGVLVFAALLGVVLIASVAAILLTSGKSAVTKAAKSVVYLETYDPYGNLIATASGFVVQNETTIITNHHVVEDAFRVVVSTEDGASCEADAVLASSRQQDLAILRLECSLGISPLRIADSSKVRQGDSIYAVGFPLGLSNTLSDGVVSSVYTDNRGYDWIQITAAISHGSSGGALLNTRGEVIGVTTASYTYGQNLNVAIPSKYVTMLLTQIDPAQAMPMQEYFHQFAPEFPGNASAKPPMILGNKKPA